MLLNIGFNREGLLAPRPTPKLEDHPSSAVRDCLFNLFAATLLIGGRSSIRNLRTRHAVVTGTHYMELYIYIYLYIHKYAHFVFQLSLQRGVMADAVWLFFLETSVDRFLEGIYIPVDCEFLVAQRSGEDAVQLTEVYRVGEGLPLQRQHFGTWDQNGLRVSNESLVRRRSNFHNYTITATSFNVSRN